jgi:hypothetical protein
MVQNNAGLTPLLWRGRGRLRGRGWFPIRLQTTPPYGHPSNGGEIEMHLITPLLWRGRGRLRGRGRFLIRLQTTPLAGFIPLFWRGQGEVAGTPPKDNVINIVIKSDIFLIFSFFCYSWIVPLFLSYRNYMFTYSA